MSVTGRWLRTIVVMLVAGRAAPLRAQGVEVMPFGGYRFGGDLFEIAAAHQLDEDGAPALGLALDLPMSDGFQLEGLFSRQQTTVLVPIDRFGPPARLHVLVDHWQGGGLQEFGRGGRVRPFLTGLFGLTRYAADADSEIRFTLGGGGGAKMFPWRYVGVRVDGRVFATFVDVDARGVICAQGTCLVAVHLNMAWQAEFTAGLVLRLP